MGKSNKGTGAEKAPKPAAKKGTQKAGGDEKAIAGAPAIDPANSAAAAAAMFANRRNRAGSGADVVESTSFRNLKESLNRPHGQTIGGALDKTGGAIARKQAMPMAGPNQVRHNQTFGADVNRKNVPRRTGG